MKRNEFNQKLREYAKTLSPQLGERDLISKIYNSFCRLLGENSCLQIGSFPRFTSITPIHDLDILFIIGKWDDNDNNPSQALAELVKKLKEYENPTEYKIELAPPQTHSVGIIFKDLLDNEVMSVDIIPAYIFTKNEFGDDVYKVPEIVKRKHGIARSNYYEELKSTYREMGWIASDPRGYIKIASQIDQESSGEFRKATKIIKKWKNDLAEIDEKLKLKSFHIEQVIIKFFNTNSNTDVFDAIFTFFFDLPEIIASPNQIKDRANDNKFIDDYLSNLTVEQVKKIIEARDGILTKLENMKENDSVNDILEIYFYQRWVNEEFLFDSKIKTFIDPDLKLKADGFVKPLSGYSHGWLSESIPLQKGLTRGGSRKRHIEFSVRKAVPCSEYRWKVRNSDKCEQPRGEISVNQTKNHPESTEYVGDHYVECYAINGNNCIARSKINVKII